MDSAVIDPPKRTEELDEAIAETVAALNAAYRHQITAANTGTRGLSPMRVAAADHDATAIQRYLGIHYPGQRLDRMDEWRWTLDVAREALS